MTTQTIRLAIIAATIGLTACTTETLAGYEPIVDRPGRGYQTDLDQCRALAATAEAKYTRQMGDQMAANILIGALTGAVIGNSNGGNYGGELAAYGALSAIAATDTEQAYGGPRRIIDRCLAARGHAVLSDIGRG